MKMNIFNLVIEGPDGVGKSTLIDGIFKHYNFRYMCYHRGDISNFIFAQKYNRPFYATQKHLPFLHIVLHCEKEELEKRIKERAEKEKWTKKELEHELEKVADVDLFKDACNRLKNEYEIMIIDTTTLTKEETLNTVIRLLDYIQNKNEEDEELSSWNKRYAKICKTLNIPFKVVDNQPYINNKPVMVETTCHNGEYETYTNKKCYDNVLYAMSYDVDESKLHDKQLDFHYIINSKIKRRHEIMDYYSVLSKSRLTCLVSGRNELIHPFTQIKAKDCFAEEYIYEISKANATFYCSRDLAGLRLQTARLYESIIAQNIVFVDKETDPDNEILSSIYPGNDEMSKKVKELLYCEPSSIDVSYYILMKNKVLVSFILQKQNEYWSKLKDECIRFYKGDSNVSY